MKQVAGLITEYKQLKQLRLNYAAYIYTDWVITVQLVRQVIHVSTVAETEKDKEKSSSCSECLPKQIALF